MKVFLDFHFIIIYKNGIILLLGIKNFLNKNLSYLSWIENQKKVNIFRIVLIFLNFILLI